MIFAEHTGFIDEIMHLAPMVFIAFMGALCNIGYKLSTLQNIKDNFSLAIWWKKNSISTLTILPAIPLLIFGLDQMDVLNWLAAINAGWTIDVMIKENRMFKAFQNANKG